MNSIVARRARQAARRRTLQVLALRRAEAAARAATRAVTRPASWAGEAGGAGGRRPPRDRRTPRIGGT